MGAITGYHADVSRITGSTSELSQLAAQPPCGWTHDRRHQQRHEVDERIQSARDRPQSAWKSRRQGRQPNFTFTDLEDVVVKIVVER